jgi:hypothetical protein
MKKTMSVLIAFLASAASAQISSNKAFWIGTNNVLTAATANFFSTNIALLTNALNGGGPLTNVTGGGGGGGISNYTAAGTNIVIVTNSGGTGVTNIVSVNPSVLTNNNAGVAVFSGGISNNGAYNASNTFNGANYVLTTNAHGTFTDENGSLIQTRTNGSLLASNTIGPQAGHYVLLSNGNIVISGNVTVQSNITTGVNGFVTASNLLAIGSVTANGNIIAGTNVTSGGNVTAGANVTAGGQFNGLAAGLTNSTGLSLSDVHGQFSGGFQRMTGNAHVTVQSNLMGYGFYIGTNNSTAEYSIGGLNGYLVDGQGQSVKGDLFRTNLLIVSQTGGKVFELSNTLDNGCAVVGYPAAGYQSNTFSGLSGVSTTSFICGTNLAYLAIANLSPSPTAYFNGNVYLDMLNTNGYTLDHVVTLSLPVIAGVTISNIFNCGTWVSNQNCIIIGVQTFPYVHGGYMNQPGSAALWQTFFRYDINTNSSTWTCAGCINSDKYQIAAVCLADYNHADGCLYEIGADCRNSVMASDGYFATTIGWSSLFRVTLDGHTERVMDFLPAYNFQDGGFIYNNNNWTLLAMANVSGVEYGLGFDLTGSNLLIQCDNANGRITIAGCPGGTIYNNTNELLTSVGYGALGNVPMGAGFENTAIGYLSLGELEGGGYDTAVGAYANLGGTGEEENTAIGALSLYAGGAGGGNTAVGVQSLYGVTTGGGNTAIGAQAGQNFTGGESGNIDIGNPGMAGDQNIIRIGTTGTQANAFIAGVVNGNGGGLTNMLATNLAFAWFTNALATNNSQMFAGGNTTNFSPNLATNNIVYSTVSNTLCLTNLQGLSTGLNYFDLFLRNTNSTTYYVWFANSQSASAASGPAAILNGGLTNMWPLTNSTGYFHFHLTLVGTNYLTNAVWECSNPGL